MISSLFIRNFRSILELNLDFTYGEGKAPNGYQSLESMPFIEAPGKQRLVPCMAFFGANASGKTNILKAFATLKLLVRDGKTLSEAYEPNLLNPKFSDTEFALQFAIGSDFFLYRIAYNAKGILHESLQKNGKLIYIIKDLLGSFSENILSDTYSNQKLADILRVECSDGEGRQTKAFLHRIGIAYLGLHADLKNAFVYFRDFLRIYANEATFLLPQAVNILATAFRGDEKQALREITDVVRRLDIDIAGIEITETELEPGEKPGASIMRIDHEKGTKHAVQVTSSHKDIDGNTTLFDFIKHESAGTQRLAGLVGLVLHALLTGGVLLVDELECSLHPLLMREILLYFKKRHYNQKGAQLIITTHNTDILDESILRLSEIALVRKTTANGTLVRRLVEIKLDGEDIRNVTNFRKQYLAGFYSAIPHPAL